MSLAVEGNWGAFGYGCGSSGGAGGSGRAGGSIPFAPGASVPVRKSGGGIGCGGRGGDGGIGTSKITGSRRLFLVRVIKPNRIGPLIRSGLAANRSSFVQTCYISSLIIESRVVAIVRAPVFCYTRTPPHRRTLRRRSISGSSSLLKSPRQVKSLKSCLNSSQRLSLTIL
jgi:hypothetical protein